MLTDSLGSSCSRIFSYTVYLYWFKVCISQLPLCARQWPLCAASPTDALTVAHHAIYGTWQSKWLAFLANKFLHLKDSDPMALGQPGCKEGEVILA